MTLRELANKIREDGRRLESYVSLARADGTRSTIFGDELGADQWDELQRLVRPPAPAVASDEQKAIWRARRQADRHDE